MANGFLSIREPEVYGRFFAPRVAWTAGRSCPIRLGTGSACPTQPFPAPRRRMGKPQPDSLTGRLDVVAHVLVRAASRLIGMPGGPGPISPHGRTVCLSRGVAKSRDAAPRVRIRQLPAFPPGRFAGQPRHPDGRRAARLHAAGTPDLTEWAPAVVGPRVGGPVSGRSWIHRHSLASAPAQQGSGTS